jgi:MoxR-like ATPase
MPSLLVLGEAGIGKTQIDRKFARLHPPELGRSVAAPRCRCSRCRCRRASPSAFCI